MRAIGIFAAGLLIGIAIGTAWGEAVVTRLTRSELAVACIDELKRRLKAPKTLQIAEIREQNSGGLVTVVYDAANGFGSMLRGEITCRGAGDLIFDVVLDGR